MKSICFYIIISLMIFSCKKKHFFGWDDRLEIKNQSELNLCFSLSTDFPDTVNFTLSKIPIGNDHTASAGKSTVYALNGTWEEFIDNIPSKTMMIFIYNSDTINRFFNEGGRELVLQKVKDPKYILKRFDVTIETLNKNDFILQYP